MIQLWRLEKKEEYVPTTYLGIGSKNNGGRWNPIGYPVIYTSQSLALASLESLVHTPVTINPSSNNAESITKEIIRFNIDEAQFNIEELDIELLPNGWRNILHPSDFSNLDINSTPLQVIGRDWLESRDAPILKVPSAIIPLESNYLINVDHPRLQDCFKVSSDILNLNPDISSRDIQIIHEGKLFFDKRFKLRQALRQKAEILAKQGMSLLMSTFS